MHIPAYSIIFQHIPVNFCLFQPISAYLHDISKWDQIILSSAPCGNREVTGGVQVEEGGLNIWTHTMCSVQCAVCSAQYMVYSVNGSACSVHCTLCSVLCVVFGVHTWCSLTQLPPQTVKQEQTTLCVQALVACLIWSRPGLGQVRYISSSYLEYILLSQTRVGYMYYSWC